MPAGFQTFDAAGRLVTEVTDRLTCLVMEGQVSLAVGGSTTVSCPGMTDTASWFVACTFGNVGVPNNGYFTLYQVGQYSDAFRYSVFRR